MEEKRCKITIVAPPFRPEVNLHGEVGGTDMAVNNLSLLNDLGLSIWIKMVESNLHLEVENIRLEPDFLLAKGSIHGITIRIILSIEHLFEKINFVFFWRVWGELEVIGANGKKLAIKPTQPWSQIRKKQVMQVVRLILEHVDHEIEKKLETINSKINSLRKTIAEIT